MPVCALIHVRKSGAVKIPERPHCLGQPVSELRAHVDFHALYGVERNEPELAVEGIEVPHLLEGRALYERLVLGAWILFVDIPIPA